MSLKFVAVFALLLAAIFGIQYVRAYDDTETALEALFQDLDGIALKAGRPDTISAKNTFINTRGLRQSLQVRAVTAFNLVNPYLETIKQRDDLNLKVNVRDAFNEYQDACTGTNVIFKRQVNDWISLVSQATNAYDIAHPLENRAYVPWTSESSGGA